MIGCVEKEFPYYAALIRATLADVERLRKPMQQITDYFLKCMGVQPSTTLIAIQPQGAVHE